MGMFLIQCGNLIRLDWKDLLETGLGHHLFPRSVAKKLGIEEWAKLTAYSWYPYETAGSGALHQKLHRLLIEQGVPFHGSKFMGTLEDFWELGDKAYESIDVKGYLKVPFSKNSKIYNDLTPQEALFMMFISMYCDQKGVFLRWVQSSEPLIIS